MEKVTNVLARLEGVRKIGGQYLAKCPVHDDQKPSLTVKAGDKWVLFYCHAGCQSKAILKAIGMTWNDILLDDRSDWKPTAPKLKPREAEMEALLLADRLQDEPKALKWLECERGWTAAALSELRVGYYERQLSLPVYDRMGKLHDVLLYSPRRSQADRRKMKAGFGKSRTLWPAPEMIEVPIGSPLFLVEGEGTAISIWSLGLKAVALPGGVARPTSDLYSPSKFEGAGWSKMWARRFSRFPKLVLVPDCDGPGRRLMWVASQDLRREGVYHYEMDLDPSRSDGWDVGDLVTSANSPSLRDGARRYLLDLSREYRSVRQAA